MSVTRTFLPWYREGFVTALVGAPPAGTARAPLPATLTMRGSSLTSDLPAELAGPGDVIGLDPREVSRIEPYDGCPDFEPSYFPYVELARPDLPWRFSPFGPEEDPLTDPANPNTSVTAKVLRPWLSLVVVPADAVELTGATPGGLPVLTTDAAQLPDAREAWAWAHVQVLTTDGQSVDEALADPTRRTARLVCPRRLEAGTRYLACLVPTFAGARTALAPGTTASDPLGPAWGTSGTVDLPVYFQWSFGTGEAGSFETLARRLRPRQAPDTLAGRVVATENPGWGAMGTPGATVRMQGALRPVGPQEAAPDPGLAESLRAAISASRIGVQLRPPLYGQDFQGGVTAISSGASGWLAELNTDARRRIAAGLAAWAVTVEQEDLADRAWQQLADAGLSSRTATSPDLAAAVGGSLGRRHQSAALSAAPAALARLARAGGPLSATGGAATTLAAISATPSLTPAFAGVRLPARPPATPGPTQPSASAATDQPAAAASTDSRFAPVFTEPAYTLLRAVAEEWLLPGAGDIPTDTVLLVQSNPPFVEAFLVGLNHALARELVWRRYPLAPTRTMFATFWSTTSIDSGANDEFAPLADWPASSDLGSHTHSPDQLVLLLRGALLRRFPTTAIYLSETHADGSETHLAPNLGGTLGADIVFLGFPLSPQEALSRTASTLGGAGGGWSIVIQEAANHARFGVDDPPETGTATPNTWQDLDWGNPQLQGHTHVPVVGPLLGVSHPVSDGATTTATWGLSSGHLAVALQQPAFQIGIPIALWLAPLIDPNR
jgi:hypothetical protein